ncbi:uncharacterized protein YjaZ [Hydrogenispora ethanolica]|uniref:Uncharacterized protein YjaZ n=1 Tax=Hydrogenispora ethanolica TaxID=1082276 RepID=A0A4R1S6V7_HYDET|nr:DUF2268 domain-containing putative Zn-dependent protease [Hydrogenispora ethanolica]TCL75085.1 uncharacterized protein YjaZ [Hydrogenispora ethanolica]
MIHWIWKYRDFITAYDGCPAPECWVDRYEQSYLAPNRELLEAIHFQPKGFPTVASILKRVGGLGQGHFAPLRSNIGTFEAYETEIVRITQAILDRFGAGAVIPEVELYVLVGLDCTNIYATPYGGRDVTVLCLESVQGDLQWLRLLLAHECHHWLRDRYFPGRLFGDCIGQRAVTEGLAIACSEWLFPGYPAHEYCYLPESTLQWVAAHWESVDRVFRAQARENDNRSGFFTRNATSGLLPGECPRIGYAYGYLKVKQYLAAHNLTPAAAVDLDWEKVWA